MTNWPTTPASLLFLGARSTLSGDFYAKMAKLINPSGLDPKQAYEVVLEALMEQIETV